MDKVISRCESHAQKGAGGRHQQGDIGIRSRSIVGNNSQAIRSKPVVAVAPTGLTAEDNAAGNLENIDDCAFRGQNNAALLGPLSDTP